MCAARNGRGWQCKRREMGAARNGNAAKYERGEMGTVGKVGGKQELWRAARREVQVLGSSHATQATKTSRQHSKAMCKLTTTHHTTTGPRTGKSGPVRISLPKLCQKSAITIFLRKNSVDFSKRIYVFIWCKCCTSCYLYVWLCHLRTACRTNFIWRNINIPVAELTIG